jgi:hypothetical protein
MRTSNAPSTKVDPSTICTCLTELDVSVTTLPTAVVGTPTGGCDLNDGQISSYHLGKIGRQRQSVRSRSNLAGGDTTVRSSGGAVYGNFCVRDNG